MILSEKASFFLLFLGALIFSSPFHMVWGMGENPAGKIPSLVSLPSPTLRGSLSVEEAINSRRTCRDFSSEPLTVEEWGQILWAAQGMTSGGPVKKRSAPSAGALYPLDVYLILGKNARAPLFAGVFHYIPSKHALKPLSDQDITKRVAEASLHQYWMSEAPGMILITAEYDRITGKYGKRGVRYAHIEAGHVAQNCFLQAESLRLDVGIVGAFEDEAVSDLLPIPEAHDPILILPVGRGE